MLHYKAEKQTPPPAITTIWKCMKYIPRLAQTEAIHQQGDKGQTPTLVAPTQSMRMKMVKFGLR